MPANKSTLVGFRVLPVTGVEMHHPPDGFAGTKPFPEVHGDFSFITKNNRKARRGWSTRGNRRDEARRGKRSARVLRVAVVQSQCG